MQFTNIEDKLLYSIFLKIAAINNINYTAHATLTSNSCIRHYMYEARASGRSCSSFYYSIQELVLDIQSVFN